MSTESRLSGKVAIIAGSTSGLGAETARLFARHGAYVVVSGRRAEDGERVAAEIRDSGGEADFKQLDVTEPKTVQRVVEWVVAQRGGLDVMMSTAGGGSPSLDGPVTEASLEEFWNRIRVDLFGTFVCSRVAIPAMIASGGGSVINTASIAAFGHVVNRDAYTSAKGGVIALTKSVARRFAADRIRVNAIAPATVDTDRIQHMMSENSDVRDFAATQVLGLVQPTEFAHAALYLASDESGTMTGQTLTIHGGRF